MDTEIAVISERGMVEGFAQDRVSLVRSQIAPQATDEELQLFLYVCRTRGLDPLAKQIYCIHRNVKVQDGYGKWVKVPKMTIQTSIDGFRSLAERTGTYAPGDETWELDEHGGLLSATVSVRKLAAGKWLKFSATAHWFEYVQEFDGKPQGLWAKMPRVMLAKVAEAKALRKGWPEQLGGLYTGDEMEQAEKKDDFGALEQKRQEAVQEHQPKQIEQPKREPPKLPPLPDKVEFIPAEIISIVAPWGPLTAVPISQMSLEDLELLREQAAKYRAHPKVTPDGKSWMAALEGTAKHRIGELESAQ